VVKTGEGVLHRIVSFPASEQRGFHTAGDQYTVLSQMKPGFITFKMINKKVL
jgi:hypothetical protein